MLVKNRTIPLLIPAIALSFYDKDHLVVVGAPQHNFKRACFEFDVEKTKEGTNLKVN